MLHGFSHDPAIHQHVFFDPQDHSQRADSTQDGQAPATTSASLNTLGYSPYPLSEYLSMVFKVIASSRSPQRASKPFIISVTGSTTEVRKCYQMIQHAQESLENALCMEINLSCPNIAKKPPPAYSGTSMLEYLRILAELPTAEGARRVAIGIKTPPYTYSGQFETLIEALLTASTPLCPIDFITATNTLGSSLVLASTDGTPALSSASGAGVGGMAGAPLHPLALGNVKTIKEMLNAHQQLKGIDIIGIGGVGDRAGFDRMKAVGATVVGVGTALGREGVPVFEKILNSS